MAVKDEAPYGSVQFCTDSYNKPTVILAGRPAAEKTADARRFRSGGLLLFFNLWNNDRIVGDRTHDGIMTSGRRPEVRPDWEDRTVPFLPPKAARNPHSIS
jgi:hypothetical protein